MVLAGIECSPKIFDFRANGIPVLERVDFLDTLGIPAELSAGMLLIYCFNGLIIFLMYTERKNAAATDSASLIKYGEETSRKAGTNPIL